jgi:hypothetical protein
MQQNFTFSCPLLRITLLEVDLKKRKEKKNYYRLFFCILCFFLLKTATRSKEDSYFTFLAMLFSQNSHVHSHKKHFYPSTYLCLISAVNVYGIVRVNLWEDMLFDLYPR